VEDPRFFFDENLLPVGKAFDSVRGDVVYPGHPNLRAVPRGAKDSEWLPVVGKDGVDLIVITQDKRIRTKPGELVLLRDFGVRMFVLAPKRDLTKWDKFELLVKSWSRVERDVGRAGPGPWVIAITEGRNTPVALPAF
jgi:hypothetical protein